MTDFKKSLAAIGAVRSKFEELLGASRTGSATAWAPGTSQGGAFNLREIQTFGANPGNLRMLVHVPKNPRPAPGLVVAMHGCGQTAAEFSNGTGWASLADAHGFVVVFPEQQQSNNPKNCFSWFLPEHVSRDSGEAASIRQMTEHAIARFGVDRRRVFVTGLSAGGAMASVMLAAYPEVYAGGAVIAGLPYGSAASMQEAFEAMFSEKTYAAGTLGDRIRKASSHRGPWPAVTVWHGTADAIVKPSNADHVAQQWLDVHGLKGDASVSERIGPHSRRLWLDAQGRPAVEVFTLTGMPHAVPLDLGTTVGAVGEAGAFFHDAGLSSTLFSARAWGLADVAYAPSNASAVHRADAGDAAAQASSTPADAIAAAMKLAGLPVPDMFKPGAPTASYDPSAIVDAALRQAGLKR